MEKKCRVNGCIGLGLPNKKGIRYLTKGLCTKHYSRLVRTGEYDRTTGRDERKAIREGKIARIPIGIKAKYGYAIVDVKYADKIERYKWCKHEGGYAICFKEGEMILMHHMIIGKPPKPLVTDHINRDKRDNRSANLRHIRHSENMWNTGTSSSNTTGHKNITFCIELSHTKPWSVSVIRDKKPILRKRFATINEAIFARDAAIESYQTLTNRIG